MDEGVVIAAGTLLLVWSVTAGRIDRADLSGPILFVLAGLVLANGPTGWLSIDVDTGQVHLLAEITLVLLLFADAARVDFRVLRHHAGLPARLLLLALPLVFVAGTAVALAVLTELPWQLGALVGAALAPTDAALSAAVVADEQVPRRVRRALNVESGLNDGIATPVVTFLIASAAVALGVRDEAATAASRAPEALVELGGGVAVGAALGWVGARLITVGDQRGWTTPGSARIGTVMLPILAFAVASAVGVNHFIAAFVAGMVFGTVNDVTDDDATELPELLGEILSLVVWLIFGATLLLPGLEGVDWRVALTSLAILTVVRMVPVALSMVGVGLDRATTAFLGWFGPRGLASVVFLLLLVEELPDDDPRVHLVVSTITLTVALSVVAHGVTARPLSRRLARAEDDAAEATEAEPGAARRPRMHRPRS